MKYGVDISHWQENVDLVKAKPHLNWIAFKASQGSGFKDPDFTVRWRKAQELGLPRVAYHYAELGSAPGGQADWFAKCVLDSGIAGRWACMLDFEDPNFGTRTPTQMWVWADMWINLVRENLGKPVAFYSFPNYVMEVMKDPGNLPGGPATVDWIARYANVSSPWEGRQKAQMYPGYPSIWQCSNGTAGCVTDVPGIGKVDYNRMNDAGYARMFGSGDQYKVEEVVEAIKAAPNDDTVIEIERKFVEDTPDNQGGVNE